MSGNDKQTRQARIFYARTDEFWRRGQKYAYLNEKQHVGNIEWQELQPDAKHNWLTEGMRNEFDELMSLGSKEAKASEHVNTQTVFKLYGRGVATARDAWVYNFNVDSLKENLRRTIEVYNEQVYKWSRLGRDAARVDNFVDNDDRKISWSLTLKNHLRRSKAAVYSKTRIRSASYRPFTSQFLYFDSILNEARYQFPLFFPIPESETENQIICIGGYGRKAFSVLACNKIADLNLYADPQQSFPFYTYNEDGTHRRENVTDWALEQFRVQYGDKSISKWDIFHYVYAVLHHAEYRARYAANLKRELPRVPFAPDFRAFAAAGARLAELHVDYERQAEYPLERIEQPGAVLDWRVERMRLSKDRRSLVYNDFLTLAGIPAEVFDYRLGNRAALEWVVDQYQVTTDRRSGIVNDPNRADDPQYIFRLVGQVVNVSLETVKLVRALPTLGLPRENPA